MVLTPNPVVFQLEGGVSAESSPGTASSSLVSIQVTEASTLEADDDKETDEREDYAALLLIKSIGQ